MKRSTLQKWFRVQHSRVADPLQRRNRIESLESRACLAASFVATDWTDSSSQDSLVEWQDTLATDSIQADGAVVAQVDQIVKSLPEDLLDDIETNTPPEIDGDAFDDAILADDSPFDDDLFQDGDDDTNDGDQSDMGDDQEDPKHSGEKVLNDMLLMPGGPTHTLSSRDDETVFESNAVIGATDDGAQPTFGLGATDEDHIGSEVAKGGSESSRQESAHNHASQNHITTSGLPADPSTVQVPVGPRLANVPTLTMPATVLTLTTESKSLALEDISTSLACQESAAHRGGQMAVERSAKSLPNPQNSGGPLLLQTPQPTKLTSLSQSSPAPSPAPLHRAAPVRLRPRLANVNAIVPTLPTFTDPPLPSLKWEASAPIVSPGEQRNRPESLKQNREILQSPPSEATTSREKTERATDLSATRLSTLLGVAVASLMTFPQLKRPSRNISRMIRDKSLGYRPMTVEPLVSQWKPGVTDTLQPID